MSLQHSSDTSNTAQRQQPLPVGAIIDADGREQPITEHMIQQACQALEESRRAGAQRD